MIFMLLCVNAACFAADARPNILFCIADDASWSSFSANGDTVCKTPNFDRVAKEGVRFNFAFCASPSCTPSRGAILTGQAIHRLESGANLWSTLPAKFQTYPDILEHAGYTVGFTRKGWGPGQNGERPRNPAGPDFKSFDAFLKTVPAGKPFCFWFGSHDPHLPVHAKGDGIKEGLKPADVKVPAFLPDFPEVRSDILDYYTRVQRFDRDVGECLKLLEESGRAGNTIVVITSDNGMPFPRGKANLYDSGTAHAAGWRFAGLEKSRRGWVILTRIHALLRFRTDVPRSRRTQAASRNDRPQSHESVDDRKTGRPRHGFS